MNETALIRVTQLPVIEEQLRKVKEAVDQAVLDAAAMVCTEETVQAVKSRRAELNKQFDALEAQRKAVKRAVLEPYERFEAVYKDCITGPFKAADAALKGKITEVEDVQKAECEQKCREYFAELCAVHGVEWLKYEQAGLKISLTEAKKAAPSGLFDRLNEFAARVACDVDAIDKIPEDDRRAAVMAEYKRHLSLSRAMADVQSRIDAEAAERKAAEERAERQKRQAEAVAKVEAAAPVMDPPVAVETPREAEPVKARFFRFWATDAQFETIKPELRALVQKMKQEGISYE